MVLPIFPLNGAVLFPGTSLPLNIFEDRYIKMVNYALAKNRHIGMIQTDENSKLYNIGCLGKIHSFNETEDGRYLISLQGVNKFRIRKELEEDYSFRLVDAEILKIEDGETEFSDNQRDNLLNRYNNYIKEKNINLNLEEIEKIELSQIIKFIAMVSPFKDIDKQALLETKSLNEFYNKLLSVIELDIAGDFTTKTVN